jgi:glycine/D-amino acid oxidase-like deaminating enzyme
LPAVEGLAGEAGGIAATLADGARVRAQLVIVAAHLGTRQLVPELHDALVSVADQWLEVELAGAPGGGDLTGVQFSANHTYEWGVFNAPARVALGGGRYLRPLAGIEAAEAPVESKITGHLLAQLGKTFVGAEGARARASTACLDIRPCDELPVIGPMFGDGRVLVAAGFMGAGLTQGFLAGRCLAELVRGGKAQALPRRLWPERLRTLEA